VFDLTENQTNIFNEWNEKHKAVCKYSNGSAGAIGGRLTFHFTPTSLGVCVSVGCVCGEKIDLTECDEW